jgi:hypothetical protein
MIKELTKNDMDEHQALLEKAACGNQSAVEFMLMVVMLAHFWDDLIDRDQDIPDNKINIAMRTALFDLPRNQFYQEFFNDLNPVLMVAMSNWQIATALERMPMNPLQECAFIIRSSYVDTVVQVANICGGYDHGMNVGAQMRSLAHRETFAGYLNNLAVEQIKREKVYVQPD